MKRNDFFPSVPVSDPTRLIQETYSALVDIRDFGRSMHYSLDRQRRVLQRAKRNLRGADAVILSSLIEEINEAILAINQAVSHFNGRVSEIVKEDDFDVVVRIRTKDGWVRSRYHESQSFRSQPGATKAYRISGSPTLVAAKIRLPQFRLPRWSNRIPKLREFTSDESKLDEVIRRYNEIVKRLTKEREEIGKIENEISDFLTKIDSGFKPDAVSKLKESVQETTRKFNELIAILIETQEWYQGKREALNKALQEVVDTIERGDFDNADPSTIEGATDLIDELTRELEQAPV